jgi:exodeoxyribonuclease I
VDTKLLREFQGADWGRRHELLRSFEDVRFQQLGRRIVFANQTDQLSEQERNTMRLTVLERWNAEDAPWTTFAKVDEGLAQVRQQELLDEGSIAALVAFYNRLRG